VATSPTQKVTMRLDRERSVKPTPALVDDLEMLLGSGSVQLCGLGTRRRKKIEQQQQPLFKQEQEEAPEDASDEAAASLLDAEEANASAE
jgi:hypothetical protein